MSSHSLPHGPSNEKASIEQHEKELDIDQAPVDLDNNVNAKIKNPLKDIPKATLFAQVASFCAEHGFSDRVPLFQKAALVAQSPAYFEDIEELDEQDRYHLRREITHKWSLPFPLYFAIGVASLGSAIQGWDNTGANGANVSFPLEFGIKSNTWLVGCINAAPTIIGMWACWFADLMNNYVGRRGTIFITGLFCVFPVLGQAFTRNWYELLICRLLMGFGMGIKITTIPIFTSEVVPANVRGGLTMTFQLWVAFGILLGYSSNLIFYRIGRLAWRFQLGAAFAPAIPILILIWLVPESPRWLLKKKRFEASFKSFCRLRNSELQAARDLYYAHVQLRAEDEAFGGSTYFGRIRDLVVVPRLRRALFGGWIVMIAQQFAGSSIISIYSTSIFSAAGYGVRTSLLVSWGFGFVKFVFAFPAVRTIDTFGRRNLLLATFPNMAWMLFLVAGAFTLPTDNSARLPLIATFIFLFAAVYAPGMGPVANVYVSECFPLSHRETGGASAIFMNNFFSTILALNFPSMLVKMGTTGAFCFFGATNVVALVTIFLWLPETKQRTLEELDYIFAVPTRTHAKYQCTVWLPWFVRRYILWQKDATLEPLYHLEGVVGDGAGTKAEHNFH
ncbi:hypothetical protein C8F01DRAFT_1055024 [Mycena amicta]|nr:hypothetical protein C8F01DRAFT_1055024 [Mycena amicta]